MSKSGPNTAEGKAAVAQNAVTHGIFSQAPVVQGVESQEEWEQHREGVIASLAPVGTLEETLAERAALLLWRQARVARFERYCIDRWQQEIEDDLKFRYQLEVGTTSPEARTNCSPAQIRAVHQQRQQFLLLLRHFPELADDAFLPYEEASSIGEAVLNAAGDPGDLSLDGEPGEQPEDLPRVRVGTLRAGLQQVAKRAGLHIAELWALTAQQAIADAAWQQVRAERLEGYFPVYHAYRVVPREEELQKVMRYEAHLSRELARLLKDFHTLQKCRRSAPAETPEPHNCKTNRAASPSALSAQPSAPTPSPVPAEPINSHSYKTNSPLPSPTALGMQNCETNPPAPPSAPAQDPIEEPCVVSPDQDQTAVTTPAAGTADSELHNCKTNDHALAGTLQHENDGYFHDNSPVPPSALSAQPSAPGPERLSLASTRNAQRSTLLQSQGNRRTGSTGPHPQNCRTNARHGKHKGRRM
jgi:hypothetical protein